MGSTQHQAAPTVQARLFSSELKREDMGRHEENPETAPKDNHAALSVRQWKAIPPPWFEFNSTSCFYKDDIPTFQMVFSTYQGTQEFPIEADRKMPPLSCNGGDRDR
jgi:hypothetical protein